MDTQTTVVRPSLDPPPTEVGRPGPVDLQAAAESVAERLFGGALAMMELATIHLGLRLGLYQALQELGPVTSGQLAAHVDRDERYVREWLEQQAVAELLNCLDEGVPPEHRRYELPVVSAVVLLDAGAPAYLGPLSHFAVGTVLAVPQVEEAFRAGTGVAFSAYGTEVRHGLGLLNGASFDRALAGWIAAMPDVDRRLRTEAGVAVLDIGCGVGRSSLALARAYPEARVHGIDLDAASVEEARDASARAGLADQVMFSIADAAEPTSDGQQRYDLVTIFEALHDMGDPVGALRSGRARLRDGGTLLIADQLTRDHYAADGDPLERFQFGCSVLHCLPATRAEGHVVAHGTVVRASTVIDWAAEAGFEQVEVLDIDDPFWRFYRLRRGA